METSSSLTVSERTSEAVALYNRFNTLYGDIVEWYERHHTRQEEEEAMRRYYNEQVNEFCNKIHNASNAFSDFLLEQITSSVYDNVISRDGL